MKFHYKILILLGAIAILPLASYGAAGINRTINPPNLNSGLIGHWTFDGNNLIQNAADSSSSGNNGNLINFISTTTVAGKLGQALQFDGVDDHVMGSTTQTIVLPVTMCAWFYHAAEATQPVTVGLLSTNGTNEAMLRSILGVTQRFDVFTNSGNASSPNGTMTLGKWFHGCGVFESTSRRLNYINGILQATNTILDADSNNFDSFFIGRRPRQGFGGFLNGNIDDVRIWNRALSAAEIKQLYNAGATTYVNTTISPPNLNSGLIGHWTFDGDKLIQNATDSSGQGNNGYLTADTSTTTVAGKIGQALSFNNSRYIAAPMSAVPMGNTMTIWLKTTTLGSSQNIMGHDTGGNNGQRIAFITGTGIQFVLGSVAAYTCAGIPAITTNTWYFLAVSNTGNGGTMTCYLNGQAGTAVSIGTRLGTPTRTSVGTAAGSASRWQGTLDDARFYNRILSDAEIQQLYSTGATTYVNTTITPPNLGSGLVGHWTFDGNKLIQNATDSSSSGNNGKLINFTSTTTVAGKFGQSLLFDGTNDRIMLGDVLNLSLPISFSAWVRVDRDTGNNVAGIVSTDKATVLTGHNHSGAWFHVELPSRIVGVGYGNNTACGASSRRSKGGTTALTFGRWYHVSAVVRGATDMDIYVNGVNDGGTYGGTGGTLVNITRGASLGYYGECSASLTTDEYFPGAIDDIRIYNRALSAAEIKQLYNLGI